MFNILIFFPFFFKAKRLLCVAESSRQEQAFQSTDERQCVLHRPAQVCHLGGISRTLQKGSNFYQRAWRETLSNQAFVLRATRGK